MFGAIKQFFRGWCSVCDFPMQPGPHGQEDFCPNKDDEFHLRYQEVKSQKKLAIEDLQCELDEIHEQYDEVHDVYDKEVQDLRREALKRYWK